jgi:class 3 adenylate cyclase
MDPNKEKELYKLTLQRISTASSYLKDNIKLAAIKKSLTEEAEIPGFEEKPMKFGQFVQKEFVVMMTDIRKSTDIINSVNGLSNMFIIFYAYSAVVAKIVDSCEGTSTEFLGDGVLNLFDTDKSRDDAFLNCIFASREILYAKDKILNPTFNSIGIPSINIGIGIDHGITIVTRFGYRTDNDLKAFGTCAYNASKLSKGFNQIRVSDNSKNAWPTSPIGQLRFEQEYDSNFNSFYKVIN